MIAWARAAIASGTTLTAAAALLEIHGKTLTEWLRPPPPRSTALVPVEVIAAPALPTSARVALVSPSGFRIEGLTLDEALRAIARLG